MFLIETHLIQAYKEDSLPALFCFGACKRCLTDFLNLIGPSGGNTDPENKCIAVHLPETRRRDLQKRRLCICLCAQISWGFIGPSVSLTH